MPGRGHPHARHERIGFAAGSERTGNDPVDHFRHRPWRHSDAVRALRAGAIDFLEKPFNDQALLDRIGEAVRISREATLRQNRHAEITQRLDGLTPRERAVLERVAGGKPNKVIAAELSISQKTVEVHRHNVMSKMGVRSAAELARLIAIKSP